MQNKMEETLSENIKDKTEREQLVNLDEGYYIFRTIWNSPAYLGEWKKDAFAIIRLVWFPSLFISQSAAGTKWWELLRPLGELVDKKIYSYKVCIYKFNGVCIKDY